MQQIADSLHEFAYDQGNAMYFSVWLESFFDNRPHYGQPLNAETIGDFHEAILAFAREVRQNRWGAIRDLGFGFSQTQIEEAAEVIE